jgi:hypothetical protein
MNPNVLGRDRAKADLRKIRTWYEREQPGLGDDFLACASTDSVPKIGTNIRNCDL